MLAGSRQVQARSTPLTGRFILTVAKTTKDNQKLKQKNEQ